MSSEILGERYLVRPDRFPAWDDEEPYGKSALSMMVCGTRFAVAGLSVPQERTIKDIWPDFVGESSEIRRAAPATSPLDIRRVPDGTFRKLERWVYELDFDYGAAAVRMAGLDLLARIELEPALRARLWIATEEQETFHGAFENFLRVVVAYAALSRGGALVHSAAVVGGDDGWLFIGHSGAGKSTVSRLGLDTGRLVLSDDLNPVLPGREGGIDVVGSPFLGDWGARMRSRHPLRAIYRLEQGETDSVRPMGGAETLASLMACAPYINFDPYRHERLCANLLSLATMLPANVLTFQRDGSFWPLLERKALVGS